jgi:hypothetical protein
MSTAEQARQFNILQRQAGFGERRQDEREISRRLREDEINRQVQERFGALRGENIAALEPYQTAGTQATAEQAALLGLSGADAGADAWARFSESPGQEFLREEQERALLRNAAAMGGLGGGNIRSALQKQAFGRAQTDYSERLARLGALGAGGLTAAQTQASLGTGPARITTGADRGVSQGQIFDPGNPLLKPSFPGEEQILGKKAPSVIPPPSSGGGGSGKNILDTLLTPGPLGGALGF